MYPAFLFAFSEASRVAHEASRREARSGLRPARIRTGEPSRQRRAARGDRKSPTGCDPQDVSPSAA